MSHDTLKAIVIEYLEREPKFRERKNKDRGIVNLLMNRFGGIKAAIQQGLISKEEVIAMVQEHSSLDRAWRQALEQFENLRGKDYETKSQLEFEKQKELGYKRNL